MSIYSYIRVSTQKQSVQRQIDNINAYLKGETSIQFIDKYTGTTLNRPYFEKMIKAVNEDLEKGEEVTIIFDSVSRMSRDAEEGTAQYFEWYDKGVNLIFLNERHVDTAVYRNAVNTAISAHTNGTGAVNKCLDAIIDAINELQRDLAKEQIRLAFEQSEKEVQDLRKRTKQGMKAKGAAEKISKARAGQSFVTAEELNIKISALKELKVFGGTDNQSKFAKVHGISRMTVYRYIQDIEQELEHSTQEELTKKYRAELNEKKKAKADK